MAQTNIPFGHPLARKVFGAAVFAEMVRAPYLTNRLVGKAPKAAEAKSKLEKMQTPAGYPIVRVTDLQKGAGDTVSVDLFNILQGKPVMGDEKLSGRMMSLTSSSMDVQINQVRGGVDTGGRMTRQRTVHELRTIGKAGLAGWYARFAEQWRLVHMAGARGTQDSADWVVPLDTDGDFSDIMVNSVQAPTYNRHFYAGAATSLNTIDATEVLRLSDIDRLRAAIDEAAVPLQPVMLPDDPASSDEPLYVLMVSPRVWHYLQTRTDSTSWRTFLQNAHVRGSKNPLFSGQPGMWNGILVRKMPRAVRFHHGDVVKVADATKAFATSDVTIDITAAGGLNQTINASTNPANWHAIDRSLLLGAQGLAEVYGQHSKSGTHFSWHEEETDHGNTLEASVSAMGGCSKLRFTDADDEVFDHGIMAIDTYAPDPRHVVVADS